MTIEAAELAGTPAKAGHGLWRQFMALLAGLGLYYNFTSIRSRIVTLNMVGVVVLTAGILYLNNNRDALIEARIKSLQIEADIIARSIAQNGTGPVDPATAANDPFYALQQQTTGSEEFPSQQPFAIHPEPAAQLLRKLIEP